MKTGEGEGNITSVGSIPGEVKQAVNIIVRNINNVSDFIFIFAFSPAPSR